MAELEQLGRQLEEMSQGGEGGGMLPWAGSPEAPGMTALDQEPVLLPEPSRREEAEAWRKALLKGMKEPPPAGYEELTQEYFRELTK
jgi:hypothetical protein